MPEGYLIKTRAAEYHLSKATRRPPSAACPAISFLCSVLSLVSFSNLISLPCTVDQVLP